MDVGTIDADMAYRSPFMISKYTMRYLMPVTSFNLLIYTKNTSEGVLLVQKCQWDSTQGQQELQHRSSLSGGHSSWGEITTKGNTLSWRRVGVRHRCFCNKGHIEILIGVTSAIHVYMSKTFS